MKKTLFVISILAIILGMSVLALDKGDFVQKVSTHATLDHGYTWYRVCNPTQTDYSLSTSNFKVNFNTVLNDISQYKFKGLVDMPYEEKVYHSDISCHTNDVNYPNGTTEEVVCEDNSYYTTETKYRKEWQDFSPAGKTFKAGTCHDILVYGDYKFDLAGVSIDNVMEYAGYSFDEYDWWNSTYFNDSFNNTNYIDTSSSSAEVDTTTGQVTIKMAPYSGTENGITHLYTFDSDATDQVGSLDISTTKTTNSTHAKFGSALNIDDSPDATTASSPWSSNQGTYESWFYLDSDDGSGGDGTVLLQTVGNGGSPGLMQYYFWSSCSGGIRTEIYRSTPSNGYEYCCTSKTSWDTGKWYHYAYTYNGSSHKVYINGNLSLGCEFSHSQNPTQYLAWNTGTGKNRMVDDASFWNISKVKFEIYNSSSIVQSIVLNSSANVLRATLTADDITPSGTSIAYYLSNDNGSNWYPVNKSEEFEFPSASYGLIWKANLSTTDRSTTPAIEEVSVSIYEQTDISESDARTAIVNGIQDVVPSATIYTDQQMYTRNSAGTQDTGTFDKVAVYGNQRWSFNYITSGESAENMANLGNRVYFWENQSLTTSDVRQQVANLINETIL